MSKRLQMNKEEIMKFAIKGVESEIQRIEKAIRNGERLLRPYRKGMVKQDANMTKIENRIGELHQEIKVLEDKLFNLRWEILN